MRTLRLLLVTLLGLILICIALANRTSVTVSLVPRTVAEFAGGRWSASMPLFLLIFLALALGMVLGIVVEWMRESHYRNLAAARQRDLAARQRAGEVVVTRTGAVAPRDEVLAILDAPKAPRPQTTAGLPVPGTATAQLPVPASATAVARP